MNQQQHKIIVLNGVSGAGKSTLINAVLKQNDDFSKLFGFSVSHTSRSPRQGETEANYHFVTKQQFEQLINDNQFLEYTTTHGNYYGTSFKAINDVLKDKNIILDIDVKGSESLLKLIQQGKFQRYPPSIEVVRQRLIDRKTETEETINIRLNTAKRELEEFKKIDKEYNYKIINDDLDKSCKQFKQILEEIISQ